MKRILLFFIIIFTFILTLSLPIKAANNKLYLHYYRFDGNYSNWNVWIWQSKPTGLDGSAYQFEEDNTPINFNFGGVVVIIDLDEHFPNSTELGVIIRKGEWQEKDIDNDRFIDVSSKGELHYYFVEGEPLIGTSILDPNGPSRFHKFKTLEFIDNNVIKFVGTESVILESIKLFKNNLDITNNISDITFENDNKSGFITLDINLNYEDYYQIEAKFLNQAELTTTEVSFSGMYDTASFNDAFYTDEELGAIYSTNETTFKLWAPLASSVVLNLYGTGTPKALGGSDDKVSYDLVKKAKGVYEIKLVGNYHNYYYTYDVTNQNHTGYNIVDPYAKGVGINGLRGLIVDFNETNPEGWDNFNKPNNIINKTDAIIYELHVRDLTTHNTWNGNNENRGLFLGLIEENTKYNGLTTGFDHIKELGITHLQLLPIFDYGNAIDETRQNDNTYNSFNWGYMPLNFNALEGNYSKDPYDGLTRINEFKQVVMAYGKENIRINMDVVYNHTGQSADSNFNLIVPGYYHRLTSSGAYSNGSGTGNETASERKMVSKFIIDSVLFWTTEYKLGGFRFDLMALHDINTMNTLAEKLIEIDPDILIYGEPWMGGDSTLAKELQAGKENLKNLNNIGAFNDDTRDGIKGSVFSSWMKGYIQGDFAQKNKLKYGIVGGIDHLDNKGYNVWHTSPTKILNYVTAHDNNTLYDKLYLSLLEDNNLNLINDLSIQAHSIILTAQGIPFIHAGDEFLRSKEISEGVFDSNSYQSSDEINQIRWDLKEKNNEHYEMFKKLIDIRKENSVFRKFNNADINENVRFILNDTTGVIGYVLYDNNETYIAIINATNKNYTFNLKGYTFEQMFNTKSNTFNNKIMPHSFILLKVNDKVALDKFPNTLSSASNAYLYFIIGAAFALVSVGAYFIINRKK